MSKLTVLQRYSARYEADLHVSLLEQAGIPVVVRGPEIGIFGPGFAGSTASGVVLLVPEDRLGDALDVLAIASADDEDDLSLS